MSESDDIIVAKLIVLRKNMCMNYKCFVNRLQRGSKIKLGKILKRLQRF